MVSSLVFCNTVLDGAMPLSNGYLLFSALSKAFSERGNADFLHKKDTSGRKFFSLSALMPTDFWKKGFSSAQGRVLRFHGGDSFAFRIAFLDDDLFPKLSHELSGHVLTLVQAQFVVTSVSAPGDHEMSRVVSPSLLKVLPDYQGVEMRFISPVGFNSDGIQKSLPEPGVLFNSLVNRWESAFGERFFDEVPRDILVGQFSLHSCAVLLKNRSVIRGCMGWIHYDWRNAEKEARQALSCLASFAFFCGVGYKTSQGLGQVLPQLKTFSS